MPVGDQNPWNKHWFSPWCLANSSVAKPTWKKNQALRRSTKFQPLLVMFITAKNGQSVWLRLCLEMKLEAPTGNQGNDKQKYKKGKNKKRHNFALDKGQQWQTRALWRCSLRPAGTNPRKGKWWPAKWCWWWWQNTSKELRQPGRGHNLPLDGHGSNSIKINQNSLPLAITRLFSVFQQCLYETLKIHYQNDNCSSLQLKRMNIH